MTRPGQWRDDATDYNEILQRLKRLELGGTAWSPGDIKAGAYTTPDDGWLACDYTFKSQALYPALFARIGHTYNGGTDPGNGTFRLPDGIGRTLVGSGNGDASGHTNHALGAKVGKETHQLTVSELASHHHQQIARFSGSGATNGLTLNTANNAVYGSENTGDTGGDTPHENRSPATVVNFFIKT